jgi:hypothetical protein
MDWSGAWWVGVLAFGIALLIGAAIYAKRKRSSGLGAAAAQIGFKVYEGPTPFSSSERDGVNLFSRGYGGKWRNMAADNMDVPSAFLFDFSYRFGLRLIASMGYSQNVAAFSAQMTSLPDFQLTPATLLDRLAPKLGLQAIRFESRPKFGKKYWLRANDEISVRALFRDALLDGVMGCDPHAGWSVEKSGRWLFVYRHGKSLAPHALPSFWTSAHKIADLFLTPH